MELCIVILAVDTINGAPADLHLHYAPLKYFNFMESNLEFASLNGLGENKAFELNSVIRESP